MVWTQEAMQQRRAQQVGAGVPSLPVQPVPPAAAAAPEDEARFVALQETDERQAAELAELRTWYANLNHTVGDAVGRLVALEQRPQAGATWPDLIARWTSRKWLAAFIPGLITVIATIGYALGDLDPRIPAGAAIVTTILTAIFQVTEGSADKAVRVVEAERQPPAT